MRYLLDVTHVLSQDLWDEDGAIFLLIVLKDGDDGSACCNGGAVKSVQRIL